MKAPLQDKIVQLRLSCEACMFVLVLSSESTNHIYKVFFLAALDI